MATERLLVGATMTLSAQLFNRTTGALVAQSATWATSNAGVASVSTAGPSASVTITGVAAGTCTITATDAATSLTFAQEVTVVALPANESLTRQFSLTRS